MPSHNELFTGQKANALPPRSGRDFFTELEWQRRIKLLAASVANMEAVNVEIFTPPIANHVPHLKLTWNQAVLKVSADDIRQQLREGNLSIEAIPTYSYEPWGQGEEIRFGVWMMQPGEAEIVARRLREVFGAAALLSQGKQWLTKRLSWFAD